jgi:glycosyltransferase involved in cell wall biosynthesis
MLPTVSVLIITYNHENYIRQCLDGVIMQKTTFPIEVIVGEDCSTDNTRSIVQEFEQRYPGIIKPVYHQENVGGRRNAYEFCYPLLKGKYIAVCEGDDYWTDPCKLQKQVDFLEQHPETAICFHRANWVNQRNEILKEQKSLTRPLIYSWQDIFHIHIPTLSAVFRNCIPISCQDLEGVNSADAFVFGMISSNGGGADLGFVGANYRVHSGGVFSQKSKLEQYREAIHVRKLMFQSPVFTAEQKKEIRKELLIRKKKYIKHFVKERQMLNCLKIIVA